ncbi:MAG: GHKL domain-containing protein [Christensenellales bacterium]|jgi:two-component system sensor histidine kinase AgrC
MDRFRILRAVRWALTAAVCALAVWSLARADYHANFAVNMIQLVLMAVAVQALGLTCLSLGESMMLLAMLIAQMLELPFARLNTAYLLLLLLIDLLVIVLLRGKGLRGQGFSIAICVLTCTGLVGLYDFSRRPFMTLYYDWGHLYRWSTAERAGVMVAYAVICLAAAVLMIWAVRVLLKRAGRETGDFWVKYRELEKPILFVLGFTLLMLASMETWLPMPYFGYLRSIWSAVLVLMVLIQVAYIRLLIKTISLKERMKVAEDNRQALALYNSELEDNLAALREVRHDVKNLFLTMGGFVERSDDAEMKRFYRERIVPFVQDTLQRSDLYAKLSEIRDESLKAFLYYKITQMLSGGVPVSLKVELPDGALGAWVEPTDLVRLLGILIDNAREEAQLASGGVRVLVQEDASRYSFTIRNATRPATRDRGVVAGTSDKGLGRGNGLIIARRILAKYRNLVLNSYFQQEDFVQQLIIAKA